MSVERILEVLQEQAGVYRQMLELEREKTAALIHNEIDRLNAIVQTERKLAKAAEELEQARIRETAAYLKETGLPSSAGSIDQLISCISHPVLKRSIMNVRGQLSEMLRELKEVNERNQQLTKQALEFIDFSIGFLMEDPNEGMLYKHPMNQQSVRTGAGIFNSRI